MEQATINLLSNYMPMVQRYKSQFLSLNALLSKTTLTGKISSLDIAENLFEYMEQTQEKFENLQERLIDTIMEQSFLNQYEEALASSKIISDTFSRNFQDCCSDISVLSQSRYLFELFCCYQDAKQSQQQDKLEQLSHDIQDYLGKFKSSYSAYGDMMAYDIHGDLIMALGEKILPKTKISAILDPTQSEYADYYQKVDFYQTSQELQKPEFFFVIPIKNKESEPIAVLVFIIDIHNEFKEIIKRFPYRLGQSSLVIVDAKNNILYTDNQRYFKEGAQLSVITHGEKTFVEVNEKISLAAMKPLASMSQVASNWKICRIIPLQVAFELKKDRPQQNIDKYLLEDSLIITEDLDAVIAEAENINEDLGDVVINGEIIASKSHSYALNPILNNIRILSEEMNTLCVQSTEELQKGIYEALFNVIGYYSKYSIEVLDLLFAKFVSDAKWLSNSITFKRFLLSPDDHEEHRNNARSLLARLSTNMPSCYNVLVYDKSGSVLLNSKDDGSIHNLKVAIADQISQLSSYRDGIIMSNYEFSLFYQNQNTFILYAAIHDKNHVIGGIAFVLDMQLLSNTLLDSLPKESSILSEKSEIFSVLFDANKRIYASTNPDFSFESFPLDEQIELRNLKPDKRILKFGNTYYLTYSEISVGTKAFRISDYIRSNLYCMIFVAIKQEQLEEYIQEDEPSLH